MLERVLIPLDGSPLSEAILPPLLPILRRARSEVLLMHAIPRPEADEPAVPDEWRTRANGYLQTVVANLSERGIDAHPFLRTGPAVRAIMDVARDEEVTMVALSTHGEFTPQEMSLGPVTQRLLRECPRPVVAMHPSVPPPGEASVEAGNLSYDSILVPLDGSWASRAALPLAWEIAHLVGARLELLRVVERVGEAERSVPPEDAPVEEQGSEPEAIDERQARRDLDDLAERASHSGVPTVSIVEKGRPSEVILSVARGHDTSLIVMATRARPEISRFLLGSVAPRIMREAKIPVLAIGSPESKAAESRAAGA